jgi:hypothetical protein
LGVILRESVLIGGWVAMWRPLEIFLYDWWPILAEARLFDRLSVMRVQVAFGAKYLGGFAAVVAYIIGALQKSTDARERISSCVSVGA